MDGRPGAGGGSEAARGPRAPHGRKHRRRAAGGRGGRESLRERETRRAVGRSDPLRGRDGLAGTPRGRDAPLGRARHRDLAVGREVRRAGEAPLARRDRREPARRLREGDGLPRRDRAAGPGGEGEGRRDPAGRPPRRRDGQPDPDDRSRRVPDDGRARGPRQRLRDPRHHRLAGRPGAAPVRALDAGRRRPDGAAGAAPRRRFLRRHAPDGRGRQGLARAVDPRFARGNAGGLRVDRRSVGASRRKNARRFRDPGARRGPRRDPFDRRPSDLPGLPDGREDLDRARLGGRSVEALRHGPLPDRRAVAAARRPRAKPALLEGHPRQARRDRVPSRAVGHRDRLGVEVRGAGAARAISCRKTSRRSCGSRSSGPASSRRRRRTPTSRSSTPRAPRAGMPSCARPWRTLCGRRTSSGARSAASRFRRRGFSRPESSATTRGAGRRTRSARKPSRRSAPAASRSPSSSRRPSIRSCSTSTRRSRGRSSGSGRTSASRSRP